MNNRFLILSFLFLIGCTDEIMVIEKHKCNDKDLECNAPAAPLYHPGEMLLGRVAGLKNCLPFVASAIGYIGNSDDNFCGIEVRTYEDWGNFYADKELIAIGARGYGKGSWPLFKDSLDVSYSYYYTMQDHDVFEDVFDLDTTYKFNRLVISSIDTANKSMVGYFNARFILSSHIPSGHNPDTIIFTNCHFEAREP